MTSLAVLLGGNALCFLFSLKGFKVFMPKNMAILPRNLEDYKPLRGRNLDVTGLIRIGT